MPGRDSSTVRAYLEHKLYALPQPVKMYYIGPMFRYERPQAGRYRQFHQFGVEVFGSFDPAIDAEVIALAMNFYHRLGLKGLELRLNSVGCLIAGLSTGKRCRVFWKRIYIDCAGIAREDMKENPLRILDCKNNQCREITAGAPTVLGSLCPECREHFEAVKEYLDEAGIRYLIDDRLVRGLDYYTKTAFEIIVNEIGAQSAICGGGRYDGLVESLGGPPIPGVGFALGMERIFPALESQGISIPLENQLDVYVIALGKAADRKAFQILLNLRLEGIKADKDYLRRSLKAQLKTAHRHNVKYALIFGRMNWKKEL